MSRSLSRSTAMSSSGRLVFVTWDGPQQPYLKSLFLPLLRGLAGYGWKPEVLQFAYGPQPSLDNIDLVAGSHHIGVEVIEVSRRFFPLSYSWQLSLGARALAQRVKGEERAVVVARSHLPAAIALAALAAGARFDLVFDTDGAMPDERVELGAWSQHGPMYRLFRAVERAACRRASRVVTRSEAGRRVLLERMPRLPGEKVVAIANGRDGGLFQPLTRGERDRIRLESGLSASEPLVVYAGSLGPQYLPEEMAGFMLALSRRVPATRWLVLSPMTEQVDRLLAAFPDLRARTIVRAVAPLEVPRFLGAADVGLALRRASPSQASVCPIKVGEYLLCGLPVVASRHIGDLDAVLADSNGAVLVENGHPAELERAAEWAAKLVATPWDERAESEACRALGLAHFSLEAVVARYAAVLAQSRVLSTAS